MIPRERFLKAVRREEPDRVPQLVRLRQEVAQRLSRISGVSVHELGIRICKALLFAGMDCVIEDKTRLN